MAFDQVVGGYWRGSQCMGMVRLIANERVSSSLTWKQFNSAEDSSGFIVAQLLGA